MSSSAVQRVAAAVAAMAVLSGLALHESAAAAVRDVDAPAAGRWAGQESGAPEIHVGSTSVRENAGEVRLIVALDRTVDHDVSVRYATEDGTAKAPGDYTSASGVATVPAGATSTAIVLAIVDDTDEEPTETFSVRLSDAQDGIIRAGGESGTVTIVDADPGPNLGYLFAVYMVTWAAFFVYVFMMSRRQRAMRDEIEALRAAITGNGDTD